MKLKRIHKAPNIKNRYVVRKPATLKDYVRIYRMKNGVLKEARKLEKTLSATH